MAALHAAELDKFLPQMKVTKLLARHAGRDQASINACIDSVKGQSEHDHSSRLSADSRNCGCTDSCGTDDAIILSPGSQQPLFNQERPLQS
jgi:hypothetical protein